MKKEESYLSLKCELLKLDRQKYLNHIIIKILRSFNIHFNFISSLHLKTNEFRNQVQYIVTPIAIT